MPKNKGKGGKNRKRGKNEADDDKHELVFKEDRQDYAQVPKTTRLNEGIAGGADDEDDEVGDDFADFKDEDIDKI